jgi:hypothetical protein
MLFGPITETKILLQEKEIAFAASESLCRHTLLRLTARVSSTPDEVVRPVK